MPDRTTNHTVFVGTKDALDDISRAITNNEEVGTQGARWEVINTELRRYHENLLIAEYVTAWAPPADVFSALRSIYPGLHIINGAGADGIYDDGEIDTSEGGAASFFAYFNVERRGVVTIYNRRGVSNAHPSYTDQYGVNDANINLLIACGVLVGENASSVRIDGIEPA